MGTPGKTRALIALTLLFGANLAQAAAYGSGWYRELQVTHGHEDNITRTYLSDEFSDQITSLSLGGGYAFKVQDNAQLVLSGYLIHITHAECDRLDNYGVSLGVDYTVQTRPAYDAPWFNLNLFLTDLTYSDSDPREGVRLRGEASINRRLSTQTTGQLGYRYQRASASEAFDTSSHGLFLGFSYYFESGATGFLEYAYRQGDINSSVSGGLRMDREYDAATVDLAFNPDCTDDCFYAYRQDGDTHQSTLGVALPVGELNFDLTASYIHAEGDNGRRYQDSLVKLGVTWFF